MRNSKSLLYSFFFEIIDFANFTINFTINLRLINRKKYFPDTMSSILFYSKLIQTLKGKNKDRSKPKNPNEKFEVLTGLPPIVRCSATPNDYRSGGQVSLGQFYFKP